MYARCPHCQTVFPVEAHVASEPVVAGNLVVDVEKGIAALDGVVLRLSQHQWEALAVIAKGGMVTAQVIAHKLYGDRSRAQDARMVVMRLRQHGLSQHIQCHVGRGYVLTAP